MTIKPIRNDDDLKRVFRRLEKIFQAEEGTVHADERDVLVTLVEAYENKRYDFGPADPVEASLRESAVCGVLRFIEAARPPCMS